MSLAASARLTTRIAPRVRSVTQSQVRTKFSLASRDAWRSHPLISGCGGFGYLMDTGKMMAYGFGLFIVAEVLQGSYYAMVPGDHGHGHHDDGSSKYVKSEVGEKPAYQE